MQYSKELAIAKRAAREAGDYLMKVFGNRANHVSYKDNHEIVTKADIVADKIIHKIINSAFPKDTILSEELSPFFAKATNGRPQKIADRLWIVDPLDGTNNFSRNIPIFAVCIALAEKENLKAGVVYLPYSKELLFAVKGRGAHLGNKKLRVSKTSDLKKSFVLQCHGYKPKDKDDDHKIFFPINLASGVTRRLGSAGYELTSVARGDIDAGYIIGTRPWDSAAGALLVREAGGRVTNFNGKEWGIWDDRILFSNNKIHKKLLKIVASSR